MKPSWTQSAASSRSPVVRTATAQRRSRCRRNSSPKASGSPSTCRAMRSRSGASSSPAMSALDLDLAEDRAVATVVVLRELGEPHDDVLADRARLDREGDDAVGGGLLADLGRTGEGLVAA